MSRRNNTVQTPAEVPPAERAKYHKGWVIAPVPGWDAFTVQTKIICQAKAARMMSAGGQKPTFTLGSRNQHHQFRVRKAREDRHSEEPKRGWNPASEADVNAIT